MKHLLDSFWCLIDLLFKNVEVRSAVGENLQQERWFYKIWKSENYIILSYSTLEPNCPSYCQQNCLNTSVKLLRLTGMDFPARSEPGIFYRTSGTMWTPSSPALEKSEPCWPLDWCMYNCTLTSLVLKYATFKFCNDQQLLARHFVQ